MAWVTPYHQDSYFPRPLSLESKIQIFRERTLGWQLDIADACINGRQDANEVQLGPIPHSGFAVLHIVLSYFEMIAQMKGIYLEIPNKGKRNYFMAGVLDVFPDLRHYDPAVTDEVLRILYVSARCGLYHAGMTAKRVSLAKSEPEPLSYYARDRHLTINPHALVRVLRQHLKSYVTELRDPQNQELRQAFEKGFDNPADPLAAVSGERKPADRRLESLRSEGLLGSGEYGDILPWIAEGSAIWPGASARHPLGTEIRFSQDDDDGLCEGRNQAASEP